MLLNPAYRRWKNYFIQAIQILHKSFGQYLLTSQADEKD